MKVYIVFRDDGYGGDRVKSVHKFEDDASKLCPKNSDFWYDEFEVEENG